MRTEQRKEFSALLATAMSVYGKSITTPFADLFFNAMQAYDLEIVREALNRHLQDPKAGQFPPKPADLIRHIQASQHDGRPEGSEAWAMALVASDENATAVLTSEIQGALWAARPLLDVGDKIAGRMAFLDAYARLVRIAREQGKPAKWSVSMGHDKAGRVAAIESAVSLGRITAEVGQLHLQHQHDEKPTQDGAAIAGLLPGKVVKPTEEMRERWQDIRKTLLAGRNRNEDARHRDMLAQREDLERRVDRQMEAIRQRQSAGDP